MSGDGKGDARVLGSQDAMMTDVADKGRQPGDPSDNRISWTMRVTETSAGGRLVPEMLMDKEFVTSRLSVEFPDGEAGEPVAETEPGGRWFYDGQKITEEVRGSGQARLKEDLIPADEREVVQYSAENKENEIPVTRQRNGKSILRVNGGLIEKDVGKGKRGWKGDLNGGNFVSGNDREEMVLARQRAEGDSHMVCPNAVELPSQRDRVDEELRRTELWRWPNSLSWWFDCV
ncbi:hypothetical protein AALP_AAs49008U000300 [Arabis alpina]|uniref:Uncharacterized protein n=1 Tax=Arabis alpina TaxID=50452 RepID=A0A087FZX7_ARAAL|nr:hypothetical protein AALP_AAs49008U000300 [Arabis alpina]